MTLDLSAVGYETEPFVFDYDWKTPVLYALGVGAKAEELDYLYEKLGPRVLPSFAVVPAYPALEPLVAKARADMSKVVHGSQLIRLHAPIPAAARLETVAKLDGIYDLKRLSQVMFSTRSYAEGKLLFETEWSLIVMDTGGFGGPRPPKTENVRMPKEGEPLFELKDSSTHEQAILYRLSGDLNPLHLDTGFAQNLGFDRPILHGLCTFGYITRAVVKGACGGDPARLRQLYVPFKNPVWPGEDLRTVGQATADGRIALSCFAADRSDAVVSGAWAEVRPK